MLTYLTAIQLSKEQGVKIIKTPLHFTRFPPNVCFSITGSHSGFWILFSCVSLVSSNLWQFYIFPCLSWPWLFWWIPVNYFAKSLSILVYQVFYHDHMEVMNFSKNTTAVTLKLSYLFSVHHHRELWCQYTLSLVMWTFIILLRRCLLVC